MYKSLKDVYIKEAFARSVPPPYMRYVINESGESIIYPFEVQEVKTGNDLIELYNDAAKTIGIKNIDFSPVITKELTIFISAEHAVTKTIGTWLNEASNPSGEAVELANGDKINAIGIENYNIVINKSPLDTSYKNDGKNQFKQELKKGINGAVFLYASILMSKILTETMHRDIGHTGGHEGIVVRNLLFKRKPIKSPVRFTIENINSKEQDNNDLSNVSSTIPDGNNFTNVNSLDRNSRNYIAPNYDSMDPTAVPGDNRYFG